MSFSRREFLKTTAAVSAATAIGMSVPEDLKAAARETETEWRWDKAVCRFCGTGCGIMIATKNDMIVAVKGDPLAPVNMGLNCIKGYFNAKIMYGADRLTDPLLELMMQVSSTRRASSGRSPGNGPLMKWQSSSKSTMQNWALKGYLYSGPVNIRYRRE